MNASIASACIFLFLFFLFCVVHGPTHECLHCKRLHFFTRTIHYLFL
jgi:hypothetical protein